MASNAVPVLVELLKDENSFIRQEAVLTLGSIRSRPEVVIPALTNLLSDSDPKVRMALQGYNSPRWV